MRNGNVLFGGLNIILFISLLNVLPRIISFEEDPPGQEKLMATFTTQVCVSMNWSDNACWIGSAPGASISSGDMVEINHDLNYNLASDLENSGEITISGATLNIPDGRSIKNFSSGVFTVLNGSLLFALTSGGSESGNFVNEGGDVIVRNSLVDVSQNWETSSGGKRIFESGCLRTGENYSNDGTLDTLINTCIEIGIHASGSFENKSSTSKIHVIGDLKIYHGQFNTGGGSGNFSNDGEITGAAGSGISALEMPGNVDNNNIWSAPDVSTWCISGSDNSGGRLLGGGNDCPGLSDLVCTNCGASASSADLNLTKIVDDSTPNVGDTIKYTIVLTNEGPDDATNVVVEDMLPSGLMFVDFMSSMGSYDSGTGLWTIGTVESTAPDNTDTLMIRAEVTSSTVGDNYAQVEESDQDDPDSDPGDDSDGDDDDSEVSVTPQQADLNLTKIVDDSTPNVGDTIKYTIVLTNEGPDDATNVVVEDMLPSGLMFVDFMSSIGSYDSGTGLWTIGTVESTAPDNTDTLMIRAEVTSSTVGDNYAQVEESDQDDPDSDPGDDSDGDDDDSEVSVTPQQADLNLTKIVDDSTPNVGDTIKYTIVLTNEGPDDATNVVVEDMLPSGLMFVDFMSSMGSYDSGTGLWTIGTVESTAPDNTDTLMIRAEVTSSTVGDNYAQVEESDQDDPDSDPGDDSDGDDDDSEVSVTPQQADLNLTKIVDDSTPNVGDTIKYTIVLTNEGPDDATNVVVEDMLPSGLMFVDFMSSMGSYDSGTGLWTIGTVESTAPDNTDTLMIRAEVTSSTVGDNYAQVEESDQDDPDSDPGDDSDGDDDDSEVSVTPQQADLNLTKIVDDSTPNVGDTIKYTIVLTNEGPDDATNVVVEDMLPSGLMFVDFMSSMGSYDSGTGLWTIGTVESTAPDNTDTLMIRAEVTSSTVGDNYTQVEESDQHDPDSDPGDDSGGDDDDSTARVSVGGGTNCSCNDFNLPLDANGMATVTPAMVVSNESDPDCDPSLLIVRMLMADDNGLRGTSISAMQNSNYSRLRDLDGNLLGLDQVRCNHVGEAIKAEVLYVASPGDTTVVCWSNANIEDKMGPSCSIDDITLECTEYRNPYVQRVMEGEVTNMVLPAGDNGNFAVIAAGSGYGRVVDVNVYVDADVADVSDLRLQLAHPGGVMMFEDLTNQDAACNGESDIDATFDNEASAYNCTGGITGLVAPQGDLSRFYGTDKDGAWRIRYQNYGGVDFTFNTIRVEVIYDYLPLVEDNCPNNPTYSYSDVEDFPNCSDMGTIERTWTVTDPGGMTTQCSHTITIELNGRPEIIWPLDTQFSCIVDLADLDPDDLEQYDVPANDEYYSRPHFNDTANYCGNLASSWNDEIFDICLPYGYKIRREWKVRDWCDPSYLETHVQFIKVLDEEAPVITAPDTVRYTVGHTDCTLDVDLPEVVLDDNCDVDPQSRVSLIDPVTRLERSNINVPPGIYDAIYTAEDACGNESWDTVVVVITDEIEPVPICDRNTNITLTNSGGGQDGWATVCWETIDDGSYDNCDLEQILISKTGADGTFQECLTYRCDDVGENEIFLRVWDESGNYSTCWGFLYVEDKVQPQLTCRADSIYCTDDITRELDDIVANTEEEWEADGLITDNCNNTTLICTDFVFEGDECAPVYSRSCYVEDQYGNQSLSCTHSVYVLDSTDWRVVSFPDDVEDLPCNSSTDPSRHGEPVVEYDCEKIGVRFDDEEFFLCGNSPNIVKIRRTWTVSNWCTGEDITHVQRIIQKDDIQPSLTIPADFNADINTNDCEVTVPVNVSAVDDCGLPVTITNSLDNQTVVGAGPMVFILPKGVHEIEFRAEDACGNVTIDDLTITVDDVKAPTARCGDITVNIKSTGIVSVQADLLDLGSDDNCTDQANLEFYIQKLDENGDPVGTAEEEIVFDCDDIDSTHMVQLIVEDDSGNRANCVTTVHVTDNDDICPGGSRFATIAGYVRSTTGEPIEDATVRISDPSIDDIKTSSTGQFLFPAIAKGQDYELQVSKEDVYREGVSTIDLIYIKRHLLQLNELDGSYQYIAADANNSGNVSTIDISLLRSLILRINDELPDNDAWRFVDANYVFPDEDNPWMEQFPEYVMSDMLLDDNMDLEFIGVKIGDLDNSHMGSRDMEGTMAVRAKDRSFVKGEEVVLEVYAEDLESMLGAQFTLEFDRGLSMVAYEEGVMQESHVNVARAEEGYLTFSWDNIQGDVEGPLFSLRFESEVSGKLSDLVRLNSVITEAEAYDRSGSLMDLELVFDNAEKAESFALNQNTPNPFSNETVIGFTLPEADRVNLKIMDISGKLIYSESGEYSKGYNEIEVDASSLESAGVYYYQIETSSAIATKKMLLFNR